jgi:hypothetical protein
MGEKKRGAQGESVQGETSAGALAGILVAILVGAAVA